MQRCFYARFTRVPLKTLIDQVELDNNVFVYLNGFFSFVVSLKKLDAHLSDHGFKVHV